MLRKSLLVLFIFAFASTPTYGHGNFTKEIKKLHYQQTSTKMSDTTAHAINSAIMNESVDHGVNQFIILSVIEIESNFTSIVGDTGLKHKACGLMQVQPRTAEYVLDKEVSCSDLIKSPKLNVAAGVGYLADRKELFHGYVSAALSAYNGGNIDYIVKVKKARDRIINMHYNLKH